MADKEKLIELLKQTPIAVINGHIAEAKVCFMSHVFGSFADHLIANGVVVSKMETTTKWIPVTERLPEKSGEYLIARSRHQLCVHYSAEHQMFNCHDTFSPGDAVKVHLDCTHWMPLPEPPKGE